MSQPANNAAPAVSDGKTLGIIAVVAAFLISLVGLILGIIAKGQSKRAGVKNTPATVAIVLGIIFTVIWIIIIISSIAAGTAIVSGITEICQGAVSGEIIEQDGVTVTCP